jgi:SAM-dependent methyltransferase
MIKTIRKLPFDILCCPACGAGLGSDGPAGSCYCGKCNRTYTFEGNVPVFTTNQENQDRDFDYLAHYRADNEAFDYFMEKGAASRHEERRLREMIIRRVPSTARTIVDVGCGNAWVAGTFLPEQRRVFSVDITPVNPVKALDRYPSSNHFALAADAFHLPFRDSSVDCVIAAEIIEHVVDPAAFVAGLMRIVRPGGCLIVTTPYRERIRQTLCIHCNRLTPLDSHLHSFSEESLTALHPGPDKGDVNWITFSNKALTMLRTHVVLTYLPHPLWRWIDAAFNRFTGKPHRILVKYYKGGDHRSDR